MSNTMPRKEMFGRVFFVSRLSTRARRKEMRTALSRITSNRSSAAGPCACRAFIDSSVTRGLYNLGGGAGNALSLREIIDKVAEIIQCNPVFDGGESLPTPVPLNYITDLRRVRGELNWEPQVGIEEG